MRMIKFALAIVFVVAGIVFLTNQMAEAKSSRFTNTFSGAGLTVPLDLDGSNPAALSTYISGGGKTSGGVSPGPYTYQSVSEVVADTVGTGCPLLGTTTCPINGSMGCLFDIVAASSVIRNNESGDLLSSKLTSGTVCLDFSTLGYVYSDDGNFTGGTGEADGVTGTFHDTGSGQFLNINAAGQTFGWDHGTRTGTMNK